MYHVYLFIYSFFNYSRLSDFYWNSLVVQDYYIQCESRKNFFLNRTDALFRFVYARRIEECFDVKNLYCYSDGSCFHREILMYMRCNARMMLIRCSEARLCSMWDRKDVCFPRYVLDRGWGALFLILWHERTVKICVSRFFRVSTSTCLTSKREFWRSSRRTLHGI